METQPISLLNTGLPLMVLGALGLVVPRLLLPRASRSQGQLLAVLLVSSGLMIVAGAVTFGIVIQAGGADVLAALAEAPLAATIALIQSSVFAALAWVPTLMLSGLALATRIEKLKGQDIAGRRE